jgi:hypothetical protein
MRLLQQILLAAVFAIGLTLTVSAQRQPEDRKKPPKDNAEIKPEDKKPPKGSDNPRNNDGGRENRPKKPQAFFLISENRIEISSI